MRKVVESSSRISQSQVHQDHSPSARRVRCIGQAAAASLFDETPGRSGVGVQNGNQTQIAISCCARMSHAQPARHPQATLHVRVKIAACVQDCNSFSRLAPNPGRPFDRQNELKDFKEGLKRPVCLALEPGKMSSQRNSVLSKKAAFGPQCCRVITVSALQSAPPLDSRGLAQDSLLP